MGYRFFTMSDRTLLLESGRAVAGRPCRRGRRIESPMRYRYADFPADLLRRS